MRSGARAAIVSAVFAAMVVSVAGCGSGQDDSSGSKDGANASGDEKNAVKKVKTGPPSAAEVKTTARSFLAAWSAGETAKAAALTDDSDAATAALSGYRKKAHIDKVELNPGQASGDKVPFAVNARIAYSGESSVPWTYESSLDVTRDTKTGKPVVDWQPSVVHPKLGKGDTLKTGESEAPPIKAVDRDGTELSATDHPSLKGVLSSLRERYGKKAGGKAGVETFISRAKGSKSPDETLKVLSKGTPGTLKTTIDGKLQSTAEQQVSKKSKASVVAVKPSTGEILAVANSPRAASTRRSRARTRRARP